MFIFLREALSSKWPCLSCSDHPPWQNESRGKSCISASSHNAVHKLIPLMICRIRTHVLVLHPDYPTHRQERKGSALSLKIQRPRRTLGTSAASGIPTSVSCRLDSHSTVAFEKRAGWACLGTLCRVSCQNPKPEKTWAISDPAMQMIREWVISGLHALGILRSLDSGEASWISEACPAAVCETS